MPRFFIAILFTLCLCSCSRVEQARQVLHEADSLRAEGRLYSDSAVMAQTVKTLTPLRWAYPTQYANANYHYGRILRERSNYTDAMQCFINATRSNTSDKHLMGRVYTNMGIICYDASENKNLAYRMFIKAHDNFKQTSDTTAYYNSICNLALGNAQQSKKSETLKYTRYIQSTCRDSGIIALSFLANSIMYRNAKQYDSAIWCAENYLQKYSNEPQGIIIKAQSFSYLGQKDSAIHYAISVTNYTDKIEHLKNAYYILQHDNSDNISKDSVNIIAANRTDIQNELDIKHRQMARAVQLLEQDMNRKPDYKGLILLLLILTVTIVAAIVFVVLKHRQRKAQEKTMLLQSRSDKYKSKIIQQLEDNCRMLKQNDLDVSLCWNEYKKMCGIANDKLFHIVDKLKMKSRLSEKEMRLCVLVLIDGLSGKQIADLLFLAETSIRSFKTKTAKKLGTDSKNMRQLLINLAIEDS